MLIRAEKKIIDGKTCIARTKPTDVVPSGNVCPGPIARGPKRKIDPFCEACNIVIKILLIQDTFFGLCQLKNTRCFAFFFSKKQ